MVPSAPDGKLPVNTNGGGLSCVHPAMYGAFATIESVRQLRGECGERQVKGAKTPVVNGNGGPAASIIAWSPCKVERCAVLNA